MSTPTYVGVDVSKAQLDVALLPSAECWSEPNDGGGISRLVQRLETLAPALIVREATGSLERPLSTALVHAQLPVVVVNPRQVRDASTCDGPTRQDGSDRCGRARPLRRASASGGA